MGRPVPLDELRRLTAAARAAVGPGFQVTAGDVAFTPQRFYKGRTVEGSMPSSIFEPCFDDRDLFQLRASDARGGGREGLRQAPRRPGLSGAGLLDLCPHQQPRPTPQRARLDRAGRLRHHRLDHVPETRNRFSTSVDAFVFEHAIAAQPYADCALMRRGYEPVPESGQRGLLVGGSVGVLNETGRPARGARSHAVRGRIVLVVVMDFPIESSDAALEEAGVFVANLAFYLPAETRFLSEEITTVELPLAGKPFALAYPSLLKLTLNSFPEEQPAGVVLFAIGDPENSNGLLTFGVRRDASEEDAATLDAWATRIAEQYKIANPTLLGQPALVARTKIRQLEGAPTTDAGYVFHVENLTFRRQNQIRVVVVAEGNDRYTLSMMTLRRDFADINRFVVYAAGVTAHEIMVDSLLRHLTGGGM